VTLPNGTKLNGASELKTYLAEHHAAQFARGFVKRLLSYSLGRSLELSDRKVVDALTDEFIRSGYQMSKLIVAVALSKPFLTK
jgi:hypothetical protein